MILQALYEYYERKREVDGDALPTRGFERKEIPFIIVLDEDGSFVDLEDTREGEGRAARARLFTVPQSEKRPGTKGWQKAFLLWDHAGYVLGFGGRQDPAQGDELTEETKEKAAKQHAAFIERLERSFGSDPEDPGARAVLRFLKKGDFRRVFDHAVWSSVAESKGNLSFRLREERRLVCERPAVRDAVARELGGDGAETGQCLVTGAEEPIAVIHPAIKGVRDAQTTGANIVSFNLEPFTSFGRVQGANAPIGESAAFGYTTALNHLLARESGQKVQVRDATTVFWAQRDTPFENLAAELLSGEFKVGDDPDYGVERIRAMYEGPWRGQPPIREDGTRFYVLGLAPNASRLSIRFWAVGTVADFAGRLLRHFDDLEIVRPPKWPPYPSIRALLRSVAVQGKDENVPPNLAGAVMRSILTGGYYPHSLLGAAVRRSALEQDVSPDRAALIKAYLMRKARLSNPSTAEVGVSLDRSNTDIGYRLGRLFAALERVQEAAHPNLNRTIRDTFYGTASSAPVTVFPRLMKLKNHHISKLEHRGQAVKLEKLIGEIVDALNDFPTVLPLEQQGRFSIGYYHQRQAFFTKAEPTNGEEA